MNKLFIGSLLLLSSATFAGELSYSYTHILTKLGNVSTEISEPKPGHPPSSRAYMRYTETMKGGTNAYLQGKSEHDIVIAACKGAMNYKASCLEKFSIENGDNKFKEAITYCRKIVGNDISAKQSKKLRRCLLQNY